MQRNISGTILKTILTILIAGLVLTIIIYSYMLQARFGKAPAGERLAKIQKSRHFKNGQFQNLSQTPELAEGYHMLGVTYAQFFKKAKDRSPSGTIPSVKNDLLHLDPDSNVLVWFGHSSYFIQVDGKRFLVDPVMSGNASPVPGTLKSFKGADVYTPADLPYIDYLIITHDHYDHLDYETVLALKHKTGEVICGLGVGAHLEHWGFTEDKIAERDWYEKTELGDGFIVHSLPARHFSGRTFARNGTLWMSFVLQTPSIKIYIGGDSGYDKHFEDIGRRFGPVDLAILDNGQYDPAWRYIHTLPDEVLKAAHDLKAKRLFPVHSSKFVLANHPWYEPLEKITELNKGQLSLVTPLIGEIVNLKDENQSFKTWWRDAK